MFNSPGQNSCPPYKSHLTSLSQQRTRNVALGSLKSLLVSPESGEVLNQKEEDMGQSLVQIYVHLIFHKKSSAPDLEKTIRPELYQYMISIMKTNDSPVLAINGIEDHVHILFSLSKNVVLAKVIEDVKKKSSKWIKTKNDRYSTFYWQSGYGAFSLGKSGVKACQHYIFEQEKHHQKKTYKEEFLGILKKYDLDYDENYLWSD
jgi:REP element-mobilizing transposase RayT